MTELIVGTLIVLSLAVLFALTRSSGRRSSSRHHTPPPPPLAAGRQGNFGHQVRAAVSPQVEEQVEPRLERLEDEVRGLKQEISDLRREFAPPPPAPDPPAPIDSRQAVQLDG